MFHRYVEHEGQKIDYDRASWLMDRDLTQEAIAALPSALGMTEFDAAVAKRMGCRLPEKPSPEEELQTLWDMYCRLHEKKYGRPFNPSVM